MCALNIFQDSVFKITNVHKEYTFVCQEDFSQEKESTNYHLNMFFLTNFMQNKRYHFLQNLEIRLQA